ncbi:hypothetical protein B2I21_18470 [Chryseobacterium mucoviscidosis]|uniref:hypothetical protein n=1 Tax=unclassified Paenibacillus TaxID=185978 RepID=UPI0009A368B2|nr:hypothetical protein [Paenibacillus sp. 11B]MDN8592796.1 hypothetical protein [Paenibacillus sp. 11B]OPG97034.1 hypothetical protein B2I21_18470 [Chryseobacterium mucoviscidosis]
MNISATTYGQVRVTPYEIVRLQTLEVNKTMNGHARMRMTAVIPEARKDSYVQATTSQTDIKVKIADDDGHEKVFFSGVVLHVKVNVINDVHTLMVDAVSHTYLLDVKLHKRSFQNPNLSYKNLVRKIISPYEGSDVIDFATDGRKIGDFVMQYEETDWQFIKRMASHFYTGVVPDTASGKPKFYFGLPEGQYKGELQASHYTATKRIADFRSAKENKVPGAKDPDYIVYEADSRQWFEVGNEVEFKSKKWIVGEAKTRFIDSLLNHTYSLFPAEGLRYKKSYNTSIIGASIQASVLQVKGDKVRAKLDMDEQQDESTAYFFPYSTIYASENNTGWYCMPEVNDSIRIYFPSKKEEDGIAISSVKRQDPESVPAVPKQVSTASPAAGKGSASGQSGGSPSGSNRNSSGAGGSVGRTSSVNRVAPPPVPEDRMGNPDIKTFRTKYGKEIMLAPDKIVISAGGMYITVSDENGIEIVSDQNVSITAGQDVVMSGQTIRIAGEKVELTGKGNTITLEEELKMHGAEIKMN